MIIGPLPHESFAPRNVAPAMRTTLENIIPALRKRLRAPVNAPVGRL